MITFKSEGYVRLTFPETSSCGGNWLMVHWLSVGPRISFSNLSGHLSFSNHSLLIHFTATFDIFCCFLLFTIALKSKTVLTGGWVLLESEMIPGTLCHIFMIQN